jgi:uncharacterized protein YxeA
LIDLGKLVQQTQGSKRKEEINEQYIDLLLCIYLEGYNDKGEITVLSFTGWDRNSNENFIVVNDKSKLWIEDG